MLIGLFVITSLFVCVGVEHKKIQGNIACQITNKIDEIFDKIVLSIFTICVAICFAAFAITDIKIKRLAWLVPIGTYMQHIFLPGTVTKITIGELVGMLLWSILVLSWISSLCVKWWLRKHAMLNQIMIKKGKIK